MKILCCLVIAMFFLLILGISTDSKLTFPTALGFIGSLILTTVGLIKDLGLDSEVNRNG